MKIKPIVTTVQIDPDIYTQLKLIAKEQDRSLRSLLNAALTEYVMKPKQNSNVKPMRINLLPTARKSE